MSLDPEVIAVIESLIEAIESGQTPHRLRAAQAARDFLWQQKRLVGVEEYLSGLSLTVEEAQDVRNTAHDYACACAGSPVADGYGPCYCQLLMMKVERVLGPKPQ